jgi:hypothetical protein
LDVKKRFSEEQIIGFLREADAGLPVKHLSCWPSALASNSRSKAHIWLGLVAGNGRVRWLAALTRHITPIKEGGFKVRV